MSALLFCLLCEWAGRPVGEQFMTTNDDVGRALMQEHVLEPHPAQARANVAVLPGGELVDVALTDEDAA